VEQKQFETQVN